MNVSFIELTVPFSSLPHHCHSCVS